MPIHLASMDQALEAIFVAAQTGTDPLGVVSVNLDHIFHFCIPRRDRIRRRANVPETGNLLNLIDGAPIASQVRRVTGRRYPKLSGSDLIEPILDEASRRKLSVAVLGGSPALTSDLEKRFAHQWSGIRFAGHWTPERHQVDSQRASREIAGDIRAAGPNIVVVCLGKPRQEEWIATYGQDTGAGVLLAFGAVVDFLTGRVTRSPEWVSAMGFEWIWRLSREPRRLARRYFIQGPRAYFTLRRSRWTYSKGNANDAPPISAPSGQSESHT